MVNADLIKSRMHETGHTQKTLAKLTGIAQSSLSLKIRNKRPMMLDEANSIAKALSISDLDFGAHFLYDGCCAAQRGYDTSPTRPA